MTTTTETMSANELAALMFYGMTQGSTTISDVNWFTRYLSPEEKTNTLTEFSEMFRIPMEYLTEEDS